MQIAAAQMQLPEPTANSTTDKTSPLIRNVLPLDFSKYSVTLVSDQIMLVNITTTEEYIVYKLMNTGSEVIVHCQLENGRLFTLMATAMNGSELNFAEPYSANIINLTKKILTNYQSITNDSSLSSMIKLLETKGVNDVTNVTRTEGNLMLETINDSRGVRFYWNHAFSGCVYNEISIYFPSDKSRFAMGDLQSRCKMGNTNVDISRDQAIDIAMNYIQNYSYVAFDKNGALITVSGFNVSRESATVELRPASKNGLLYPTWRVEVPLLEVYPGHPAAFAVDIWAGTGSVLNIATEAVGADYSTDNSSSGNGFPSPSSTVGPSAQQPGFLGGICMVVSLIAVLTSVVVLKKRQLFTHH